MIRRVTTRVDQIQSRPAIALRSKLVDPNRRISSRDGGPYSCAWYRNLRLGRVALTGLTRTRDEIQRLVRFLDKTASGRVYAGHNLSDCIRQRPMSERASRRSFDPDFPHATRLPRVF